MPFFSFFFLSWEYFRGDRLFVVSCLGVVITFVLGFRWSSGVCIVKRLGAALFVFTEKKHQWTSDNWYQEADSVKSSWLSVKKSTKNKLRRFIINLFDVIK